MGSDEYTLVVLFSGLTGYFFAKDRLIMAIICALVLAQLWST